ncbi:hypothetical protein [Pseudovibrio sp. Tun.PSC04-5.I4]|uniref:hypothetical protein n=1 Tax=Pseudovibrio sp. Tun.PSC04-5.I4 TaxID=1798213 RepID=UPI000880CF36|nr:hypothetical protein [Pseudovibrio sp. Tun.PSC04-5.I4]SDQ22813.1 hypothetical protein SAMN04515695_0573 [Pseudovibrio sp. Tun.PSC04-5.I4]
MKKILVHIGAHKTGTTALQKQLYAKHPDLFDDRTSFKNSAFMTLYENRLIKPKASQLAELFQEAIYRRGTDTYRLSHERLMGKPFHTGSFYPYLKRYVRLVEGLQRTGVEVETLVTVQGRTDYLISLFLHGLAWRGARTNFHDFANNTVTSSFAWQAVADQLKNISVTYLPQEAMENDTAEFVGHINKFYELKLLEPNDIRGQVNLGLNDLGFAVIPQLSTIEDKGLRKQLLACAFDYCKKGARAEVMSKDVEDIYRKHFNEGDIAFAKTNFPAPFREIYSQSKPIAEQFWFAFANADA